MNDESPITLSVPEAGKRYFGLSRNGAYDAAARGEIPTVKIGRLLRVPIRAMERMLDQAGKAAAYHQRHDYDAHRATTATAAHRAPCGQRALKGEPALAI